MGSGLCGICFFIGLIQYAAKIVKGEGNCENLFSKIAEPSPIFCKDSESREKTGACSQFSEALSIFRKDSASRGQGQIYSVMPRRSLSE
ncbi:MAG TPA: hypothetical protein DER27_10710 [Alistipes sp.]|nr:hypothetical protein [Alistipes sp.]